MYASVHAKQLWFVRRTSINLNYSWNTIHHNLKTASVSLKLYKEESNERQLTGGKRKNNKAKRIIWGQNLKRKPELAVVGVNYFHLHLSVCCSHTHAHTKKKWWEKFLCYASCPGLEVAVSQRMSGNLVLRVLTGMMNMLSLADSFSAQKSQDCIVVGGGNHE